MMKCGLKTKDYSSVIQLFVDFSEFFLMWFNSPKILGYSSFYLCVVKGTKMENRKNFRKIQKSEVKDKFFVISNM